MEELFKLIIFMYLSSSLVTIIFYLIFLITKKMFSAKWNYLILKVNLIFFIIPLVFKLDNGQLLISNSMEKATALSIFNNDYISSITRGLNNNELVQKSLLVTWIIVICFILIRHLVCYFKFRSILKDYNYQTDEAQLTNLVIEYKKILGTKRKISIRENRLVKSPMLIGFFNYTIILPKDMQYSEEIKPMIMHELIHLKRKDMWIKQLQLIISVIYWFNPLVYLLNRMLDDWCEISCDEIVVKNMTYSERKKYGQAILDVIKNTEMKKYSLSIALCSDKNYLKTRLLTLLESKPKSKANKGFSMVMLLITVVLSIGGVASVKQLNLFSKDFKVRIEGSNYVKEFNGGQVEFNKETGDVKVLVDGADVDENEYKQILDEIFNEGEIK